MRRGLLIILLLLIQAPRCTTQTPSTDQRKPILNRLMPVPKDAGFRVSGYFVWGGSVIFADGMYHLFASRWPTWETLGIGQENRGHVSLLSGYKNHSEIVRAVADNPLGPYEFAQVVVAGRGGDYWDGQMCHNPKIAKIGDRYVLYYIGRSPRSSARKIGYAVAESIEGPWQRREKQIMLTDDANNPAPYIEKDGRVLLAFRDQSLVMHVARADRFDGRYEILAGNIVPGVKLEDPTLFFMDGRYHMVLEDNKGQLTGDERHGAQLVSRSGRTWQPYDPVKVYTHTIQWTDDASTTFDRRERPELVNLNNPPERKYDGEPTHLVTGVQIKGESWCVVQPIAPIE